MGTTSNKICACSTSGPVEHLEQHKRPISFDLSCRNLHLPKSKRAIAKLKAKKKRSVHDLGSRVEPVPSYFTCISPRNNTSMNQVSSSAAILESDGDSTSNGTLFPCFSHTKFEVIHCNNRLWNSSN